MQYIRSRENTHVKHIRKLGRSKDYRQEHQECIVEGFRALTSFLDSRHTVIQVYVQENRISPDEIPIDTEHITIVPASVMEKMSAAQTPSGILGHIQLETWHAAAPQAGVALVEMAAPGNIGTLIRSSIALGHTTITLIACADPWNPKSVQASAGAIAHAYIHTSTWENVQSHSYITTCALTAYDAVPISDVPHQAPLILVGNEAHGLPQHICDQADYRAALHMPGPTESYNAAVAGSIALYSISTREI